MKNARELAHIGRTDAAVRHDVGNMDIHRRRIVTVVRWLSMLLMLAALLTIVGSLPIDHAMGAMKSWMSGLGVWGPVVLVLVYSVATVLFVPGTILTLAAGAMFGLVVGTVTVSIGSTLGASLAFLISRYVARSKIAAMAGRNRRFGAIDRAIAEGGWKIVALLRMSPLTPFILENYLYGLTRIRFWPYVVASWLAMLPGTFLYVYLGHVAGTAMETDRSRSPGEWTLLAIGLLATVVGTVYITRLVRRKLQEHMSESPADGEARPIAHDENRLAEGVAPRLRHTVILAAVALIMVGAAVYVHANAGAMQRWFAPLSVIRHSATKPTIRSARTYNWANSPGTFASTRPGFISTRDPTCFDLRNSTTGMATTSISRSAVHVNSPHVTHWQSNRLLKAALRRVSSGCRTIGS